MKCIAWGVALVTVVTLGCQPATRAVPLQQHAFLEGKSLEAAILRVVERQEFRHSEFGSRIGDGEDGLASASS